MYSALKPMIFFLSEIKAGKNQEILPELTFRFFWALGMDEERN
jgi:hypothetical protein